MATDEYGPDLLTSLLSPRTFISSLNETNTDDVFASNSNHSLFGDGSIGSDLEFITPGPIFDGMNTTMPFFNLVLPSDSIEEVKEEQKKKKRRRREVEVKGEKKKKKRRRRDVESEGGEEEEEEEEEEGDDDVSTFLLLYY